MRRTPALIVGAGPAGCAAAITLARAGAPHLLVERARTVGDPLCGGFLSWRTLEQLARLGIDARTLNTRPVRRVVLFANGRRAEASLPSPALAVSRHRLDTRLAEQAVAQGARLERGVALRAIDGGIARIEEEEIAADALFLASGKHDVRGAGRPITPRRGDPSLGLRVRLAPSAALQRLIGDAVELHLFDRGYAGLAIQEDGSANLCLAVHRSRLHEAASPAALIAAIGRATPLGDRLADWNPDARIDAVANVPYGWRETAGRAGRFRLGDQAGVIPSLAGEGMGIALASGTSAAGAYLRGGAKAAAAWQPRFARDLARPLALAGMVRRLGEGPARGLLVGAARLPGLVPIVAALTRIGTATS